MSASIAEIEGGGIDRLERGRYLRFEVIDNGPGMSPELAARALQPFYTTKPVGAGSGLGLPMAKGFADQSGGVLQIASGPEGTTVAIVLPVASAEVADDAPTNKDQIEEDASERPPAPAPRNKETKTGGTIAKGG